eukprot:CAMPEP_0174898946 /NCGR_PEP_ID=MMETSP0167-20121228/24607_1 /TAXON_ID=38298 /ORGANISM="Rhodella maculata, Strain CCMP736" /LENGTH=39 /DNA_ID= /DNA_START= /DNA_END= /DNA_ORIENTATION=
MSPAPMVPRRPNRRNRAGGPSPIQIQAMSDADAAAPAAA